jgi:hypothetical protein
MSEKRKERIVEWLRAAPVVRGMLMRGIRFPDQTFVSDEDPKDFPAAGLEQAWRLVGDTFQVLSAQQFPPSRLSWVYERVVLHCAQRPDGAILGIFLSRRNVEADSAGLNRLLAEFQGLELAEAADGAEESAP